MLVASKMPAHLVDRLRDAAGRNGRTISAEVCTRVLESFEREAADAGS